MNCQLVRFTWCFATIWVVTCGLASAQSATESAQAATEEVKFVDVTLADGKVTLSVPADWKEGRPRSRILEREFAIPKPEGADAGGRLTIMQSGGSVKANVDRWIGQFQLPEGKAAKDGAKVVEKKIDGYDAVIVDISGTYKESIGPPFARKFAERPNYRMLGAIVKTPTPRPYFIKLTGPQKTLDGAAKPFMKMIESIKSK